MSWNVLEHRCGDGSAKLAISRPRGTTSRHAACDLMALADVYLRTAVADLLQEAEHEHVAE